MCNEKREKLLFFKFKSYISDSAVSIIKERLGKRLIKVKKEYGSTTKPQDLCNNVL